MSQHDIWLQSEADAWYLRNAHALERIVFDPVRTLLRDYGIIPQRVLDIGCASGARLEAMRRLYGAECVGVEPSLLAVLAGQEAYPKLDLQRGTADALPVHGAYDLVLMVFVAHWLDRAKLLASLAEIDRVTAPGGYVCIADFAPDVPTKVRYHHRQDIELWTYKLPCYGDILTATGLYSEVARITYDHDAHERSANVGSRERGMCALLRKGDYYCVAS